MPRLVVVTERNSGEVALILPLLIAKERKLTVARFADLGVSDYGGPILGPALIEKARSIRRAWRAVLHAMPDVDLIRLERMPAKIGGRPNPLLTRLGITPARHSGNVLDHSRYRRSVSCARAARNTARKSSAATRLWEKEGAPRFYRATTPEEIARVLFRARRTAGSAARSAGQQHTSSISRPTLLSTSAWRSTARTPGLRRYSRSKPTARSSRRFSASCTTVRSPCCASRRAAKIGDISRRDVSSSSKR